MRTRFVCFLPLLVLTATYPESRQADLLLFNANVITMNSGQTRAQAIAVQGGRIVWVGTDEEGR